MNDDNNDDIPFWRTKTLAQMNTEEWESLCDGCGLCCLVKLEDIDTGDLAFTNVACRLFDCDTCRCTSYENRHRLVPDCISFTASSISELEWMPGTCAYRLISEGRDLYHWHPLVSNDPKSVHKAGISARGRVVSEQYVDQDDLINHVVKWDQGDDKKTKILK